MAIPQIEFGLSEIGVFEFALEQGSLKASTKFIFEGGSEALFGGVVKSNSAFFINSSSRAASFKGQLVKLTEVPATKGVALVALQGASLRNYLFTSTAGASAFLQSGLINQGRLHSEGASLFEAINIEEETLDIRGTSKVSWMSGYKRDTSYGIQGKSLFTLDRAAVAHALLNASSTGESGVSLFTQGIANTSAKSENRSTVLVRVTTLKKTQFQGTGSGVFTVRKVALANSTVKAVGRATISLKGYSFSFSRFGMNGVSVSELRSNFIRQSVLEAVGNSSINIRPGSPVLLDMPVAWDVVIRPYENRETIWK